MMRAVAFAWIALLVAVAALAGLSLSSGELPALLQTLSPTQQLLVAAIAIIMIWLAAATAWQARALSHVVDRSNALESRIEAFRTAVSPVEEAQRSIESAENHIGGTGPDDVLESLHKRMTDSETRTATQEGQNRSADLQERLQEIRERQVDLRNRIGEVISERRTLEPTFSELSDRQKKIEASLSEMELDDNRNSLFRRMEDFERSIGKSGERLQAVQVALASLSQLKEQLSKDQAKLVPLQATSTGVKPLAEEVGRMNEEVIKALNDLEKDGDATLSSRIDALSKSKSETEHRTSLLDGWNETLGTLRREFEALKDRLSHINRSISEVETDSSGTSLVDLIKNLNDQAGESRARLWELQKNLSVLGRSKDEFSEMETILTPLKASDGGVLALSSEVQSLRDRVTRTLDMLERQDDTLLTAQVEQLRASKKGMEVRIAQLQDTFESLDAIRSDVSQLFERLKSLIHQK